jgi:cation transport ATPase
MSAALTGTASSPGWQEVELSIRGMTCAACAARVEKKLGSLENVTAAVNFATGTAAVTASAPVPLSRLIEAVEQAGYGADLARPAAGEGEPGDAGEAGADAARVADLRRRLIVALVFFVPLSDLSVLLSLFPWARFPGWQWGGQARGAVAVADTVKPSAAAAVAGLHGLGLRTVLVTGDSPAVAETVAAEIGADEVIAGALPADKVAVVRDLQAKGRRMAVAGDGVNDGPALAAADLGLALGTGTDVAISAADMILLRDDLGVIPDAIRLARATLATIRRNLAWAFGYNIAAIPLAAAGFLNPLIAGAAMAASSAFVVASSIRLRRFGTPGRPGRGRQLWRASGQAETGGEPDAEALSCPG